LIETINNIQCKNIHFPCLYKQTKTQKLSRQQKNKKSRLLIKEKEKKRLFLQI